MQRERDRAADDSPIDGHSAANGRLHYIAIDVRELHKDGRAAAAILGQPMICVLNRVLNK